MQVDLKPHELFQYQGSSPCPADIDEYWDRALAEMAAVDAQVELVPSDFQVPFAECYDLWFTGVKGARVHAKYLRPKNIEKPGPAIVQFHGYSGSCGDWWDKLAYVQSGFCIAAIDCRGQGGQSEDVGGVKGNTLHGHIIRGLDSENPVEEWQKHISTLQRRANYLNENNFEYLYFCNSLGTDIKVGLAKNHFVANIPTEEIFTAPHKDKINGVVYSALPLSLDGKIVDEFSLTFKDGKVVDFSAKTGYDTLKELIATDEGTLSLGEVALIGKNSPIAKSGILFYNTLFDENASCHLALGKGYPTTIKGGESLTTDQLKELGVNDSVEHIDFMIGTPDLQVYGIKPNGEKVTLFVDGEWII